MAQTPTDRDRLVPLGRLSPMGAVLLLAALLIWGLCSDFTGHASTRRPHGVSDPELYEILIRKVHAGASYYATAPEELRRDNFPLRPFLAVRPPLLTVALAKLPNALSRQATLLVLAAATFGAWAWRLWPAYRDDGFRFAWALALLFSGVSLALAPVTYLFHEAWAGLLIALSIAIRGRRLWIVSVGLGLLAALIRELSFPFLGVMALFAVLERRRGEACAWAGAFGIALVALAQHALAVGAVTSASDPRSPGWLALGGYPFVVKLATYNPLTLGSPWLAALLLPIALLGLLAWRGGGEGRGARAAFIVLGYAIGFCVIGRPNNGYWGLLIAPLWPLGLLEADKILAGGVSQLPWNAAASRFRP